jgi:hypothetical protein
LTEPKRALLEVFITTREGTPKEDLENLKADLDCLLGIEAFKLPLFDLGTSLSYIQTYNKKKYATNAAKAVERLTRVPFVDYFHVYVHMIGKRKLYLSWRDPIYDD